MALRALSRSARALRPSPALRVGHPHDPRLLPRALPARADTGFDPRSLCTGRSPPSPTGTEARARTTGEEIRELRTLGEAGAFVDASAFSASDSAIFPRIKTTSLSTKRVVIHDKAAQASATLVLVAFRRFAEGQLASWRRPFLDAVADARVAPHRARVGQVFDVTINESFASQALSGFVQRVQRRSVDARFHDFHVAFNDRARKPLEKLLPLNNRLYGYALLLDAKARVRFRAAGLADEEAVVPFVEAARALIEEDARPGGKDA